jgi:mannose-1-phosphate guanylyltransferase
MVYLSSGNLLRRHEMKTIILAGGSGERFWPLSTTETPKQFLKLFGEKTLLRQTFERLSFKASPKDIYIVTHRNYKEKTLSEIPELPEENILLEPSKKNTAPACTFASLNFQNNETIFIVPADHYIPQTEKFWHCVEKAQRFLEDHEGIITFGIVPSRPETSYGYIEIDEQIEQDIFSVKLFREKPNYETAVEYVNSGSFYWNSGMFMYKKDYFVEQMKKHAPQVIEPFLNQTDIESVYQKVPSVSIDYALMEKADRIYMVKSDFIWSDVGNFKSLKDLGIKNSPGVVLIDSNAFVKTTKPTMVIGLKDIIVVETENGILIADEKQLERIKEGLGEIG